MVERSAVEEYFGTLSLAIARQAPIGCWFESGSGDLEKYLNSRNRNFMAGDQNEEETLVPIPNTKVKLLSDVESTVFGREIQGVASLFKLKKKYKLIL